MGRIELPTKALTALYSTAELHAKNGDAVRDFHPQSRWLAFQSGITSRGISTL